MVIGVSTNSEIKCALARPRTRVCWIVSGVRACVCLGLFQTIFIVIGVYVISIWLFFTLDFDVVWLS